MRNNIVSAGYSSFTQSKFRLLDDNNKTIQALSMTVIFVCCSSSTIFVNLSEHEASKANKRTSRIDTPMIDCRSPLHCIVSVLQYVK